MVIIIPYDYEISCVNFNRDINLYEDHHMISRDI